MSRTLVVLILGLLSAGPARAQEPCSLAVGTPIFLSVSSPACPGEPIDLLAAVCGPCADLIGWTHHPGEPIRIRVASPRPNCFYECMTDSLRIPLGTFAAGQFTMIVQVETLVGVGDTACVDVHQQQVNFDVPRVCLPPVPLPYTEVIRVGAAPPCPICPAPAICPGHPIPFFMSGRFTDDCTVFEKLELLPSPLDAPLDAPLPQPPVARVTMRTNDCQDRPCHNEHHPWKASALMPPLPSGSYHMFVEVRLMSWCDSSRVVASVTTPVPFTVAASCSIPPPPSCYLYGWQHHLSDIHCEARIAHGTPAKLVMNLSQAELAGLEGRLVLSTPALAITGLRLVGPGALGMRLLWSAESYGASFATFRESDPMCGARECPWGIEAIVAVRPNVPVPAQSTLAAENLLATDALGREMPLCPTFAAIMPARICAGPSCDWNGDGQVDVRDLVLMVRCLRHAPACSDSTGGAFDCDRDGRFDLDDVLCCARVILHGPMHDSVATRPAPDLRLVVGAPLTTATGVDVPVRVRRADLVGAARLEFSYPAQRFDGVQVELLGGDSRWIELSEAVNGALVVGLIATAPDLEVAEDLELLLRFAPTAGQPASHDIRLVTSEFAGRDGVPLRAGGSTTGVPTAKLALELSAARPNPFGDDMRFTLGLSQGADADLAIFDLNGRRVVTLHHGALDAGTHDFRWDGRTESGARVPDGVYFYRAEAADASTTRKVVLLRTR